MTKAAQRKLISVHEWLGSIYGIGVALSADNNELVRSLGDQLKGYAHHAIIYLDEIAGLVKPDEDCNDLWPETVDCWEMVADDATISPIAYLQKRGMDADVDVDDATEKMATDLVARCKRLAGVE